jgi:Uma2 family endonuclease
MPLITVVNESRHVTVPSWVVTLDDFHRWLDTDDIPERARVWFIKGNVWVDISMEQVYTHGQVKTEFFVSVGGLVKAQRLGLFLADGTYLTNIEGDFSGIPDALFVSNESLTSGRVHVVEGAVGGFVEIERSPDMVLEVVSQSSVTKDTVTLKEAYWQAGITEYWLVDAHKGPLRFDILSHTSKGYVPTRKQASWVKSNVFRKAFRLTKKANALGHPDFVLDAR